MLLHLCDILEKEMITNPSEKRPSKSMGVFSIPKEKKRILKFFIFIDSNNYEKHF